MQTRALGIGCLAVSLLAWLAIGVAMVIDVSNPTPATPTLAPATTLIAVVPSATSSPTASPLPTNTPTEPDTATPVPPTVTPLVAITDSPQPSPLTPLPQAGEGNSATQAATVSATGTGSTCTPPTGWIPYHVADGDTLFGFVLGSGNTITVEQIMQANCLHDRGALSVGEVISLPPGVAAKAPKIDDGPPGGTLLPAGLSRTANCPCSITVHSGWRLEQIASRIDAIPVGFTGRDFLAVTASGAPTDGFSFLSGKPASASFEGFMYPGDYTLSNSTTALQFRDMMLHQFDQAIPQQ